MFVELVLEVNYISYKPTTLWRLAVLDTGACVATGESGTGLLFV
jgi:hypothetical protein